MLINGNPSFITEGALSNKRHKWLLRALQPPGNSLTNDYYDES